LGEAKQEVLKHSEVDQEATLQSKAEKGGIPRGGEPSSQGGELTLQGDERSLPEQKTSSRDKGTISRNGETALRGAIGSSEAAAMVVDLNSLSEEKRTEVDVELPSQ
jgi:hypothetical protein